MHITLGHRGWARDLFVLILCSKSVCEYQQTYLADVWHMKETERCQGRSKCKQTEKQSERNWWAQQEHYAFIISHKE